MNRTIDISLVSDNTKVVTKQVNESHHKVYVCLYKEGFTPELDGTNRSIRVSFGALPSDVHWNDILDKPDMAEPLYWEEMK